MLLKVFLEHGVISTSKRRILPFVFTVLYVNQVIMVIYYSLLVKAILVRTVPPVFLNINWTPIAVTVSLDTMESTVSKEVDKLYLKSMCYQCFVLDSFTSPSRYVNIVLPCSNSTNQNRIQTKHVQFLYPLNIEGIAIKISINFLAIKIAKNRPGNLIDTNRTNDRIEVSYIFN